MNRFISGIQDPASTNITEMQTRNISAGGNTPSLPERVNVNPSWTDQLDAKYGTKLMSEEGIGRTNAASILNSLSGQYASSIRQGAPIVQRNSNNRQIMEKGLLSRSFVNQEQLADRAKIRPRRTGLSRYQRPTQQ